jgi:hypothetical protein
VLRPGILQDVVFIAGSKMALAREYISQEVREEKGTKL